MKFPLSRYLVLLGIFSFGIFFFLYFTYNHSLQILTVLLVSTAYFFWGIAHHYLEKNLYWKVVIEYFLVALLGATIVISLILRA
jgi:uncharacterized membrane protein YfcA